MKKPLCIIIIFVCCVQAQLNPEYVAQGLKRTIDINAGLEPWKDLPQYPVALSNTLNPVPVSMPGYF
jgi:hypothetical protein